jgi:hypothetical protein
MFRLYYGNFFYSPARVELSHYWNVLGSQDAWHSHPNNLILVFILIREQFRLRKLKNV